MNVCIYICIHTYKNTHTGFAYALGDGAGAT